MTVRQFRQLSCPRCSVMDSTLSRWRAELLNIMRGIRHADDSERSAKEAISVLRDEMRDLVEKGRS